MCDLSRCPCGKVPSSVVIAYGPSCYVSGDCCGEWAVEYSAGDFDIGNDEYRTKAEAVWNNATRDQRKKGALLACLQAAEAKLALVGEWRNENLVGSPTSDWSIAGDEEDLAQLDAILQGQPKVLAVVDTMLQNGYIHLGVADTGLNQVVTLIVLAGNADQKGDE